MSKLYYVSGGISGYTREVYTQRFDEGVKLVEAQTGDTKAVNPLDVIACPTEDCNQGEAEKPHPGHEGYFHTWNCYLRYDLIAMLQCDAVLMLSGWWLSRGAALEREVALRTGMEIWHASADTKTMWQVYPTQ